MGSASYRVPVCIVGGGPTGLTVAILLSQMGVPAALFERRTSPEPHPRAHYINNRTMETLRSIPEASQTVARLSPPLDHWRRFVYSTGLPLPRLPRVLASVDHFPGAPSFPADPAATPSPVAHVPQHAFSATLLDRARRMSAAFGSALSLFEGWEVAGVDDHGGGAVVTARRGEEEARVACDWVVACDGAGSRVRKRAGMDMEGEPCIQTLISAHFRSRSLGEHIRVHDPAMLHFLFSSKAVCVLVCHDLVSGEFVAQIPFYPPSQVPDDFTPSEVARIIRRATELELRDILVEDVRPWTMAAQVARSYRAGRILFAGDSAHVFPPAGGFGMNTGIQDAHNLAWKLALATGANRRAGREGGRGGGERAWSIRAERGAREREGASSSGVQRESGERRRFRVSEALVDTYDAERRPTALTCAELAVGNWAEASAVPAAIGLDHKVASGVAGVIGAVPLPRGVRRAALEGLFQIGLGVAGAFGAGMGWSKRRLEELVKSGRTLRMQFPWEDLGTSYEGLGTSYPPTTPARARSRSRTAARAGSEPTIGVRSPRDEPFRQEVAPGGRMPHTWLVRLGGGQTDGWRGGEGEEERLGRDEEEGALDRFMRSAGVPAGAVSTHDLLDYEAPGVLLIAQGERRDDVDAMAAAVREMSTWDVGMRVRGAAVHSGRGRGGGDCGTPPAHDDPLVADWQQVGPGVAWASIPGNEGVLVVRPDGYVAAVVAEGGGTGIARAVQKVLHLVPCE